MLQLFLMIKSILEVHHTTSYWKSVNISVSPAIFSLKFSRRLWMLGSWTTNGSVAPFSFLPSCGIWMSCCKILRMVRRMIQLLKTVIPMGWMLMIMLQNLPKVYIIFHIPEWGNYAFMCGKGYDICDWKIYRGRSSLLINTSLIPKACVSSPCQSCLYTSFMPFSFCFL